MGRKTNEQFLQDLKKKHGDKYTPLEEYIDVKTKIKIKCNECQHVWETTPLNLLNRGGCSKCANKKRRKTNEQFLQDLKKKHGDKYTPLEEYTHNQKKIKIQCNDCQHIWETSPTRLLNSLGCPKCLNLPKISEIGRKTNEQFLQDLKKKHGDKYTPLEEYTNCMTKIKIQCNECNNVWETSPTRLLSSLGCPKCLSKNRRKTNEQFLQDLKKKHGDKYTPLEEYINATKKIKIKCNTCQYVWETSPNNLLSAATGCPSCGSNYMGKSHEQFLQDLKKKHGDKYTPLEEYTHCMTKIKIQCNECNQIYEMTPSYLLRGGGCPYCSGRLKTNEKFLQDLNIVHGDKYTPLEEYINSYTKIKIQCNRCQRVWETSPKNLLHGNGCQICSASKGEIKIYNWLKTNKFNFKYQYSFDDLKDKRKLLFDFKVNIKNNKFILIEFDGKQHKERGFKLSKERFEIQKHHDVMKDEYCKNKDIFLLRILYNDFDNIEQILNENLGQYIKE